MNKKNFIRVSVYIVIVLIILLLGGIIYFRNQSNHTAAPAVSSTNDNLNLPPPPSEPVPTTNVDNSSSSVDKSSSGNATCSTPECLYQNFSACNPSSADFGIGDASTTQLGVHYQILGSTSGGCKMSYRYTQNPNPEWINKDITCVYDNKLAFQQAFTEEMNKVPLGTSNCFGPLMNVIPKNN